MPPAQSRAEQIDMADMTGRDHNRFGMSVNQTDVHASGKNNSNVRAAHTVDGDAQRLTPVSKRSQETSNEVKCQNGEA
jgi:hypothetical protein